MSARQPSRAGRNIEFHNVAGQYLGFRLDRLESGRRPSEDDSSDAGREPDGGCRV